jgi:hypothetical protein
VKPKLVGYINFNKYLWNRHPACFIPKITDSMTVALTKSQNHKIISNPHFFGIILSFLFPWCPWRLGGFITHKLPDLISQAGCLFHGY